MTDDKLVEVYSTDDANQAEILKGALAAENIDAVIEGENQGGFAGLTAISIKLFVRSADAERAREYLEKHGH